MTLAYRDPAILDSPPARWDPRWKLAAMLVFVAAVATLQSLSALGLAFGITLGLSLLARIPVGVIVARAGLLLLSVAPFAAVLPAFVENGWRLAASIALRCVAIGLVALFLLRSAPLASTLSAARSLGMPGILVLIAQLAYRYTLSLFGEARRLRVAMVARGFRVRTTAHAYRSLGHAAGALVVSGGERAERVAAAMKARGFDGTPRRLAPFRTRPTDWLAFAAIVLLSVGLVAGERTWP